MHESAGLPLLKSLSKSFFTVGNNLNNKKNVNLHIKFKKCTRNEPVIKYMLEIFGDFSF